MTTKTMETRCTDNLVYEHRHDGYRWHPKTRVHKEQPEKMALETCANCGDVGVDLNYDEHIDQFLCDRCAMKNEIGKLGR